MQAVLIKDHLADFNGHAALYKLTPALSESEYVVVSAANVPFSGPETYIFPSDDTGEVTNWLELDGSYRGGLDHHAALSLAGYSVVKEGA